MRNFSIVESAAGTYMVCAYYGVDNMTTYIKGLSKQQAKDVLDAFNNIYKLGRNDKSSEILKALNPER